MFVPALVVKVLLSVGVTVAGLSAVILRVLPRGGRRVLICLAGIALGILIAVVPHLIGVDVILVRQDASGFVAATRARLVGTTGYRFADGHTETLGKSGRTLVVNDTPRVLRVETVYYGSIGLPSEPRPIPAMTAYASLVEIDNVGPDHPPPAQVESSISFEIRHWLTW